MNEKTDADQNSQSWQASKAYLLALLLILALAVFLRFFLIEARGLWFDEAVEFWTSLNPLDKMLADVKTTFQPPFFNFVVHFWSSLGSSELWLRTLSVIFDILGIVAAYLLINELFQKPGIGLAVAAFLMVSPALVRYAQELAEYSLVLACLQWSLFFGIRALKTQRWAHWIPASILAALAFYTHYGAVIPVSSFYLSSLIYVLAQRDRKHLPQVLLSGLLTLLLCLPLLPMLLQQAGRQESANLLQFAGLKDLLYSFLSAFVKTFSFAITGHPYTKYSPWFGYTLIIGVAILAFTALFRKKALQRWAFLFFVLCFGLYFLLVRSGAYAYGGFGFRYMLVLVPAFGLLLGLALSQIGVLKNRPLRYFSCFLLLASLIGLSLFSLPNRFVSAKLRGNTGWPEVEQINEVHAYWLAHKKEGSHTYVYYGAVPTFGYYQYRSGAQTLADFPAGWVQNCWSYRSQPLCDAGNIHYGDWFRAMPLEEKLKTIETAMPAELEDLWMVFAHITGSEMTDIVNAYKAKGYTVSESFGSEGAVLYHLQKQTDG